MLIFCLFGEVTVQTFCIFLIGWFILLLSCQKSLYILNTSLLSGMFLRYFLPVWFAFSLHNTVVVVVFNIYSFILAALGLSCGMQDLCCGMWDPLVAACGLLSCCMHAGSSSLTRDRTQTPCIGSTESYPLDHQGSPNNTGF